MNRIQKVLQEAKRVKDCCTIRVDDRERFQVALMDGAYESLRRLARAVDDLDNHERKVT